MLSKLKNLSRCEKLMYVVALGVIAFCGVLVVGANFI